jgi:hypothetical protein
MEINGVLVFASSVAALVAHPQFVKRPNFQAISHYLTTFRLTLGREGRRSMRESGSFCREKRSVIETDQSTFNDIGSIPPENMWGSLTTMPSMNCTIV